jgi:hypothetical protein
MLWLMQLPRFVAAGVCAAILGAQLWVSFPISKETRGWYWPFLPYPMYAAPHTSSDSFIIPELRVAACGTSRMATVIAPASLGIATEQLNSILTTIVRAPNADNGRRTSARLSRAIDAEFPGRYCAASAWVRVVSVADTATHHVSAPMHLAATWSITVAGIR